MAPPALSEEQRVLRRAAAILRRRGDGLLAGMIETVDVSGSGKADQE